MWSQKPPEAVLELQSLKIFLEEHAPRPPSYSLVHVSALLAFPPLEEKSCINPCLYGIQLDALTI